MRLYNATQADPQLKLFIKKGLGENLCDLATICNEIFRNPNRDSVKQTQKNPLRPMH